MIVVKFGGHAMKDENGEFAKAIASALATGESVVVVHGGGPQIDVALNVAGIESKFIGGFRFTTKESFKIVEQVLVNEVGPKVANVLSLAGISSKAISGRSWPTLVAKKKVSLVDGTPVDLGQVGDVVRVDTTQITELIDAGFVPVVSPLANEESTGEGLNVNADLAAAAIAGAVDASALIIMTDVAGIYRSWPDKASFITSIYSSELESLKSTFAQGMAPKVQAALDAISAGAKAVRIIDGTDPSSFANALLGTGGTLVIA